MLLVAGFVAMFAGIGASTAAAEMTEYFEDQGSSPLDIVAGAEGDLWYTGGLAPSPCLAGAVRLVPPGGITKIGIGCGAEGEAFVGSGANGITLGPDGNLWFTAGGGIGRIKPSATESEDFLLPPVEKASSKMETLPNTSLGGITTGPEHEKNLWFTEVENSTNKIDRINPTKPSEITEFTLPPGNQLGGGVGGTTIDNIAAGPNDTVWFAEPGSHAIGVVNTKGEFLDQVALGASDDPQSIAAGPEGNMWFTDPNSPYAIGRINAAGEASEFPAPSAPASIVAGPDGNMWFTEGGLGAEPGVGCIIPTGQIELQHERTAGGDPEGITVNNGSLWFTERQAERLSQLDPVECGAKPPAIIAPPPNSGATTTPSGGATTPPVPTTQAKGSTPPAPPLATVLGLPSAQQCVSKRTLLVHVHAPPGQQLLSVKLSLGGRVLRAETFTRGRNDKVPPTLVDLRGLPKGTFTLTIIVKTKAGKTYRATRTYHTCVPGKREKSRKH